MKNHQCPKSGRGQMWRHIRLLNPPSTVMRKKEKRKTKEAVAMQKTSIKCKEILFGNSITSKCECCSKCCASAECKTDSHTKFKADSAKYTKRKQDWTLSQAGSAEIKPQALPGAAGQGAGSVPDSPDHGWRKENIDASEDAFWTAVYKGAEAMDAFIHSNMKCHILRKANQMFRTICTKT